MHDVDSLIQALGEDRVAHDSETIGRYSENVLGISRKITAVVFPESTDEVVRLVRAAGAHGVPLHPLSRGRNLGYSDRLPTRDGAVIVDLGRMGRIRSYDEVLGQVVLEAGVSQRQLYEFLLRRGAPFLMDATGAGLDSSVVGNSLEGGFGHTPRGNRRAQLTDLEIVLGNGELLQTGTFPGFGPDLAGLFVQSSFGIVTAMRLTLTRRPSCFVSFLAQTQEDVGLEPLIDRLRELRQRSTLTSLVHVANALRSFMTTRRCPPEFRDRPMTQADARELMSTALVRVGAWSAIGGLYGEAPQIDAHKRVLRAGLRDVAKVRFFTNLGMERILRVTRAWPLKALPLVKSATTSLESFQHVHGLMCGIPSDEAQRNIAWRVANPDDMGLLWFAPAVEAVGNRVRRVVEIAETLYAQHRFEMPVTFTLVTPERVVGAFSISFNKREREETARAHALYHALRDALARERIYGYRTGILGMDHVVYPHEGKLKILRTLKSNLDPSSIISPGRYGL